MQFDMFAAAPAAPPPAVAAPAVQAPPAIATATAIPAIPIPRRTVEWESLLKSRTGAADLVVMVANLWTGVVLEVLHDPVHGYKGLHRDGQILDFLRDDLSRGIVYATAAMAREWHRKRELIPFGSAGTGGCSFRFGLRPGAEPLAFPQPFQEAADGSSG